MAATSRPEDEHGDPSEDEEIARSVAQHGWHAISVADQAPEFVYTCGLMTTFSHPEAIILGLPPPSAYSILAAMVEDIRGGRSLASPGVFEGVLEGLPIAVRPVHPTQHQLYLGYAMGHCRYKGIAGGLVVPARATSSERCRCRWPFVVPCRCTWRRGHGCRASVSSSASVAP